MTDIPSPSWRKVPLGSPLPMTPDDIAIWTRLFVSPADSFGSWLLVHSISSDHHGYHLMLMLNFVTPVAADRQLPADNYGHGQANQQGRRDRT